MIRRRTNVAADLESRVKQQTRELSELSTHLQRASETEKFALARELHDELGGLLIAIKMDLAQLRAKLDLTHADVLRRWERIQSALSAGIDLKRRIIEQLRPSLLDNMGLIAAVQWQAEAICSAAGLQLTESFPETEPTIDPEAAIAVFRIAQEALTNIVKHARASNVRVEIANVDDELRLIVADDGAGFSPGDNTKVGAHGIKSMRHRLLPFDGTFAMEAVEPQGTRIRIALPLRRAADPLRAVS